MGRVDEAAQLAAAASLTLSVYKRLTVVAHRTDQVKPGSALLLEDDLEDAGPSASSHSLISSRPSQRAPPRSPSPSDRSPLASPRRSSRHVSSRLPRTADTSKAPPAATASRRSSRVSSHRSHVAHNVDTSMAPPPDIAESSSQASKKRKLDPKGKAKAEPAKVRIEDQQAALHVLVDLPELELRTFLGSQPRAVVQKLKSALDGL